MSVLGRTLPLWLVLACAGSAQAKKARVKARPCRPPDRVLRIEGPAEDLANRHLPDLAFTPRPDDYDGDPRTFLIARCVAMLIFSDETTVAQANAILQRHQASIVAGNPGGQMLVAWFPATSVNDLSRRIAAMKREVGVDTLLQDMGGGSPD